MGRGFDSLKAHEIIHKSIETITKGGANPNSWTGLFPSYSPNSIRYVRQGSGFTNIELEDQQSLA